MSINSGSRGAWVHRDRQLGQAELREALARIRRRAVPPAASCLRAAAALLLSSAIPALAEGDLDDGVQEPHLRLLWRVGEAHACKRLQRHRARRSGRNAVPAARHGSRSPRVVPHRALVGGDAIEGHVPAGDIERLLREVPSVIGLSVPGMVVGSPGMEQVPPQPYSTIAFDERNIDPGQTQPGVLL